MQYNLTVRAVVYDNFGHLIEEKQVDFEEFSKSELSSDIEGFLDVLEEDI